MLMSVFDQLKNRKLYQRRDRQEEMLKKNLTEKLNGLFERNGMIIRYYLIDKIKN